MPFSSSSSKTSQTSTTGSEDSRVSSGKSTLVTDSATYVNVGKGANTGTQFGDVKGDLIIGDTAAISDLANKTRESFSAALGNQSGIISDALGKLSDLSSGGEQSTKKTVLWVAVAAAALYFFSRK